MSDLGSDGLTDDERTKFRAAFLTGIGHKPGTTRDYDEMLKIICVSAEQYARLTAPDHPDEVPTALRELVLRQRDESDVT